MFSCPGRIRKSVNDGSLGLCEGYNCECNELATREIQGETDTFGYETFCLCDKCYDKMLHSEEDRENEIIEANKDKDADDDHFWILIADVNDDYDWVFRHSKSYGKILIAKDQEDAHYGAHGGLYKPVIRLATIDETYAILMRYHNRWEEDQELWNTPYEILKYNEKKKERAEAARQAALKAKEEAEEKKLEERKALCKKFHESATEPEWTKGEFPNIYKKGWTVLVMKTEAKTIYGIRKGDQTIIDTNGCVPLVPGATPSLTF